MIKKIIHYSKIFLINAWEAVLVIGLIIFLYYYFNKKADRRENDGVVTVARIKEYRTEEQGSTIFIEIYLKGKVITATTGGDCYYCEGKFFFVKVLNEDPTDYPILYMDKPVPDCIIENVKYFKGWKDFPTCSNY